MAPLATDLRRQLENAIKAARVEAEAGARSAVEALAVGHHQPHGSMTPDQRNLRNRLRAHGRQLGDTLDPKKGTQTTHRLVRQVAYEHWHRMLFARFLAENHLLIEPASGVAITLEECEELARERGEDPWAMASTFAQHMLPQIFKPEDPALAVTLPPEIRQALQKLLADLPTAVFAADDSLGWTYQFWQAAEKDAVNRSEVKIGADELPAVTQLFTEPYMVQFLLHNTLGAWWAGKRLTTEDTENTETEAELRKKVALPGVTWDYLRFVRAESEPDSASKSSSVPSVSSVVKSPWKPAAGTFDGWPKEAKDIKVLDPCCGSGHFLVAALHHLVPIRMAEEGLSAAEAVDAVLRDNLHGLEIDERCCQIAAFALAFEAWKMTPGGYRELPELHVACTGIGPQSTKEQWLKLAEQSGIPTAAHELLPIQNGLLNLHHLFSQAPTLGSLINPAELPADLIAADYETIQPYLAAVLKAEKADDETRERAVAAAGMAKAADLLAGEYTLITTNVPYLTRGKQAPILADHADSRFPDAKADLATVFVQRCLDYAREGGTTAVVTPENWLFLTYYVNLRKWLIQRKVLNGLYRIGEGGFRSPQAAGAFCALSIITNEVPPDNAMMSTLDVARCSVPEEKQKALCVQSILPLSQHGIRRNPESRIVLEKLGEQVSLGEFVSLHEGMSRGDTERYDRKFWEVGEVEGHLWSYLLNAPEETGCYRGREHIVFWESGNGTLSRSDQARLTGYKAWGKPGIFVARSRSLRATLSTGEMHAQNGAVLLPNDPKSLPAVWTFCSSPDFYDAVRAFDKKIIVASGSLLHAPFDVEHWNEEAGSNGSLPEPESDAPSQWLFHGRPDEAEEGTELQVAVARLLGYRWPAELEDSPHPNSPW